MVICEKINLVKSQFEKSIVKTNFGKDYNKKYKTYQTSENICI